MKTFHYFLIAPALALAGCGGGSSDSAAGPEAGVMTSPDAVLGVVLTDAPSNDVEKLIATISRVELVGAIETLTVFEGSETVDLLELPDAYELFTVSQVTAGTYDLVRIEIMEVTIVTEDGAGNLVETPATLPSSIVDVMLVPPVTIGEGAVLFLEIDFDVDKALERMFEQGGDLILEPVIFVEIDDESPRAKVTRIHGAVSAVTDAGFQICDTQLVSSTETKRRSLAACADVLVDDVTTYFGEEGIPIDRMDIVVEDPVTVVGYLDRRIDGIPAIPHGHLPPPGECRLWYLDRSTGNQPPPEKCENFEGMDIADNAVLLNDQGLPVRDIFGIDALVLEEGSLDTYRQYRGKATTTVANDQLDFLVDGNQGVVSDLPILTRLFPDTRIFSTDGTERDSTVIQPELKATVDSDTALTVATDMGDRCVDADGADVFLVSLIEGHQVSEKIELRELAPDQAVDVFGFEGIDGCFDAETILADGGG